jgi:hypothetical protein
MTIYGENKRSQGRLKRELKVEIKIGAQVMQIYSIDLSSGGVKVGGAMLKLTPGEQVELSIEKDGGRHVFQGQVERGDGTQHINRIGRDANAFFIRILDERFLDFIKALFT